GWLVPVVGRAVEKQLRTLAGYKVDEAVRHVRKRDPYLERCVHLEGVGSIVLKNVQKRPGMHQKAAKAAGLQRLCCSLAEQLQVRAKCCGERGSQGTMR